MRKFRINVNGSFYDVEVEEVAAGAASAPVAAAPVAPAAPQAPAAPVAAAPVNTNVDGTKVEAPMPGNILAVNVAVGDTVAEGDVLVILEAMKMENEINAPVAGKVLSVGTSKGSTVETGDVLVVIG